jgi:hypothetical protein
LRARTQRQASADNDVPRASTGFTDSGPAVAAVDQTSCSRFDLNTLLKQLVHDHSDTVHFHAHLCSEPLPVFANIGHLSNALQELLKFLAGSTENGEAISLSSTFSSAKEMLKDAGAAGQFLFPVANWNVAHSSRRTFGVVKMLKAKTTLPENAVAAFLKAARNLGNARDGDAGVQRLGRIFRKHRINLFIVSSETTGTMIRLFVSLAENGK